jgi:hypothetical protein
MTPPLDPQQAENLFAAMLDDAGLPQFSEARHDEDAHLLELSWDHGLTLHFDLTDGELDPIDDWDRAAILDLPIPCGCEPLHITIPGSAGDPREDTSIPGVVIHRSPPLHPDDVTVHMGLPMTTPSRTLIDLAEVMDADELRRTFARARDLGLLDPDALRASRARVEWRPSLAMLDEVIAEFCG